MTEEYITGAVIPDDMPEELLGNPDVQRLIDNAHKVLEHFDSFIDPESDAYREELYEAKRDGAQAVMEQYHEMLANALYRQRLFDEQFDLERFVNNLSKIDEVEEALTFYGS